MPSSDRGFARAARTLVVDARSPEELQTRLRSLYPRTVVRERALANEPRVLYIYRDGRYERDQRDPWWQGDGLATAVIDLRSGIIVHASREWATLLGDRVDAVAGRRYTEFLLPEARDAAAAVIQVIQEAGEITSEALMRRVDGSTVPFQFHATRSGDRISVVYRRRPD
jgi:PAS domain S-box-containing protein